MSNLKRLLENILSTKPKLSWADYVRALTGGWHREYNVTEAYKKAVQQGNWPQTNTVSTTSGPTTTTFPTVNHPIFGAVTHPMTPNWGLPTGTGFGTAGIGAGPYGQLGNVASPAMNTDSFIDPTTMAAKERMENAERAYKELVMTNGVLASQVENLQQRLTQLNTDSIEDHALRDFLINNYPDVLKEFAEVRRTFWEITK